MLCSNETVILINGESLDREILSIEFSEEDVIIDCFLDEDIENAFTEDMQYIIKIKCGNFSSASSFIYNGYSISIKIDEPVIVSFNFSKV